jgi:transcription elongation factor GreA
MPRAKNEPIPITAAGLAALQSELAGLVERRPSMVDRVASARSDGDLKENFAYHDARRDLGMADGRAQTIEAILQNAVVVDATVANGEIGIGSNVVVADELGESSYTVVGPAEVDLSRGLISLASPLGAALMGRGVGDTVSFTSPGGERSARIVRVD